MNINRSNLLHLVAQNPSPITFTMGAQPPIGWDYKEEEEEEEEEEEKKEKKRYCYGENKKKKKKNKERKRIW
jgi:hypothetical protein